MMVRKCACIRSGEVNLHAALPRMSSATAFPLCAPDDSAINFKAGLITVCTAEHCSMGG